MNKKDKKSAAPQKVGRGNPPKDTRFKPGQSGNPRGRPKGASNFATVLQQQLRKTVTIAVEGKPRRMAAQEVIALRLTQDSMKGSTKAMELLFRIAGAATGDATDESALELAMPDKETLRRIRKRLDALMEEDEA